MIMVLLFVLLLTGCGAESGSKIGADSNEEAICGGLAGFQCGNENQVCIFPVNSCNVADGFGACMDRPEVCTAVFDPVCGCDGMTYSNSCAATAAGISVNSAGACP
ncbi:MAG: Kazal domain-containing protein [Proteobacteria bacterium]|jgi:hypothetical protein|nr:Kazal domain-containing protein [Pseudomonadota bacterium]